MFLCGSSLGATVTLMGARANAELVRGCVLLYLAFNLHDAVRQAFPNRDLLADRFPIMSMDVSGEFLRSCYDYDFYEHIPAFPRDVLLFHGDADKAVPLSYSQRAASLFPNCELRVILGGRHGFTGEQYWQVVDQATDWLRTHMVR